MKEFLDLSVMFEAKLMISHIFVLKLLGAAILPAIVLNGKLKLTQITLRYIERFIPHAIEKHFSLRKELNMWSLSLILVGISLWPAHLLFPESVIVKRIFYTFLITGVTLVLSDAVSSLIRIIHNKSEMFQRTDQIDLRRYAARILKTCIFFAGLWYLLDAFDILYKVLPVFGVLTFLVAGMGIAARDYIANFFGSLAVILGRPFDRGDIIVINGHEGEVEEFGFQAVRLRTRDRLLIFVPYTLVMTQIMINKSRTVYRAVQVQLHLDYQIDTDTLKKICTDIRQWIMENDKFNHDTFLPRVRVADLEPRSIDIYIRAFTQENDLNVAKEEILLASKSIVENHGGRFLEWKGI